MRTSLTGKSAAVKITPIAMVDGMNWLKIIKKLQLSQLLGNCLTLTMARVAIQNKLVIVMTTLVTRKYSTGIENRELILAVLWLKWLNKSWIPLSLFSMLPCWLVSNNIKRNATVESMEGRCNGKSYRSGRGDWVTVHPEPKALGLKWILSDKSVVSCFMRWLRT